VYLLELYAVGAEPLAVGVLGGQPLLDLAVVVDTAFLGVDEQDLARLQASLLGTSEGSKSMTPTSEATTIMSFLVMV
jgi:hypothetical protein